MNGEYCAMVGTSVSMADLSMYAHLSGQLDRLCEVVGFDGSDGRHLRLLRGLLGTQGEKSLTTPPEFPSNVADDTTPIEFSVAFDTTGECVVRVLGETVGSRSPREFLDEVAGEYGLVTDRLDAVADLFLPHEERQGPFTLWYSLIFRPGRAPKIKVYLNPQISGPAMADSLVNEGLRRLNIAEAYDPMIEHALRRGERDNFSFFALDLDDDPLARVKVYVSHEAADSADAELAAGLVPGTDPLLIREFLAVLGGGKGPFEQRPLVSSYSFVEGSGARPANYSVYLPIRSYVPDDEVASARARAVLAQYGFDGTKLDKALAAVSQRPLSAGVGLIAHVSLRMGEFGSGITVYLSSEAYQVLPARKRPVLGAVSCLR
ncbi:tryptophan dimethylallyltransferase family protein [Amycolatopsis rhabdoformis]|uniref:Tryptophan dimethylallyltransferase family protein n=1 Tax=Amycolatopsis rhabdoformis TaxID=1448059 RepID=A0ABZ1I315_9PSEU|nr:tryptophan dimethylallyltransferase family protein [Amycolatopsis rhabdoformis]WSE28784.1 tryptophan dimethylallyltransferase family protein [Amycolatopsis rhabdoformis]